MRALWRWLVRVWRPGTGVPSPATENARQRLENVCHDDARVKRLHDEVVRVQRENNLGPQISRALRARRP